MPSTSSDAVDAFDIVRFFLDRHGAQLIERRQKVWVYSSPFTGEAAAFQFVVSGPGLHHWIDSSAGASGDWIDLVLRLEKASGRSEAERIGPLVMQMSNAAKEQVAAPADPWMPETGVPVPGPIPDSRVDSRRSRKSAES